MKCVYDYGKQMLPALKLGEVGPNSGSSCFIARELSSLATGHGVGPTGSSLGDASRGSDALAQSPRRNGFTAVSNLAAGFMSIVITRECTVTSQWSISNQKQIILPAEIFT
jgi:hypothetical protein